jgi:hypothetical protein
MRGTLVRSHWRADTPHDEQIFCSLCRITCDSRAQGVTLFTSSAEYWACRDRRQLPLAL